VIRRLEAVTPVIKDNNEEDGSKDFSDALTISVGQFNTNLRNLA